MTDWTAGQVEEWTDHDHKKYREEKTAEADQFEDFVQVALHTHGISICNFKSYKYQCEMGENIAGFEIKRDGRYRSAEGQNGTGNLFIEIAEKSKPSMPRWTPSGIYRDDNSYWYVVGDEVRFWVFGISLLRLLHKDGRYPEKTSGTGTSRGFLMPVAAATRFADMIVTDGTPDPISHTSLKVL